ncbi:MAG: signal peptidase I [Dehalococcoidia bacterium]|nr:signal peptidase I [Dehalococcoidia bacterium]
MTSMNESMSRDDVAMGTPSRALQLVGQIAISMVAIFVVGSALIYAGLQVYGVRFYEIQSESMQPTFSRGDVIAVKSKNPRDISVGDVLLYKHPPLAEPIAHRVVAIESAPDVHSIYKNQQGEIIDEKWNYAERFFFTQGDGNNVRDQYKTSQNDVIGVQRFVVPWPFGLIATSFSRQTLFFLGGAAVLCYIVWELVDASLSFNRRRRSRQSEV